MAPTRLAIPGGTWVPFLSVAARGASALAPWSFLPGPPPSRCGFLRPSRAFSSCSASYNSPLSLRSLRSPRLSSVLPPLRIGTKKTGRYSRTSPLKIKLSNCCNVVAQENGGLAPRQSSQAARPLLVKADVVVYANCVCYYCCYDCHYHKCCHHNQFFLSQIVNSLPPKGQLKFNFLPGVLTTLFLNCTAKVRIVCEHSTLFSLIFPSSPPFLAYINPLDLHQSTSQKRNSSEFLWSSD